MPSSWLVTPKSSGQSGGVHAELRSDVGCVQAHHRGGGGNHEWLTPGAGGWKSYFGLSSTYYQTLVNGWTVYVIDSNCS